EPSLVVLGFGGIEDPLREPSAHAREILRIRGSIAFFRKEVEQVRIRADKAVPNVEDFIGLIGKDVAGHPEVADVLFAEERRLFEQLELFETDRRPWHAWGSVGVSRNR